MFSKNFSISRVEKRKKKKKGHGAFEKRKTSRSAEMEKGRTRGISRRYRVGGAPAHRTNEISAAWLPGIVIKSTSCRTKGEKVQEATATAKRESSDAGLSARGGVKCRRARNATRLLSYGKSNLLNFAAPDDFEFNKPKNSEPHVSGIIKFCL